MNALLTSHLRTLCASQFQREASPGKTPGHLKKLVKCPVQWAIFVGKCPALRSYYDSKIPGPPSIRPKCKNNSKHMPRSLVPTMMVKCHHSRNGGRGICLFQEHGHPQSIRQKCKSISCDILINMTASAG